MALEAADRHKRTGDALRRGGDFAGAAAMYSKGLQVAPPLLKIFSHVTMVKKLRAAVLSNRALALEAQGLLLPAIRDISSAIASLQPTFLNVDISSAEWWANLDPALYGSAQKLLALRARIWGGVGYACASDIDISAVASKSSQAIAAIENLVLQLPGGTLASGRSFEKADPWGGACDDGRFIDFLSELPVEIRCMILGFVPCTALAGSQAVCTNWRNMLSEAELWEQVDRALYVSCSPVVHLFAATLFTSSQALLPMHLARASP